MKNVEDYGFSLGTKRGKQWIFARKMVINSSHYILKLPQIKKNRIGVALPFFVVGHNWILNCGN